MLDKVDLVKKFQEALEQIPDLERMQIDYCGIVLADYAPLDSKYQWRQFEINFEKENFIVKDDSEWNKCEKCGKYHD